MDPINIPPLWDRIYTSTMDPSWERIHHLFHPFSIIIIIYDGTNDGTNDG